ncbi:MAG: hypothetical protein IJ622_03735 [Bacteroidales bacterium]|nr:hypothetical protein [Bacteroidales bacterium]
MNKHLISIALASAMGLFLASCGNESLVGTWVEPAAEGSYLGEVGFTLLENGEVKSINTGFREYTHWEQNGKKLIIGGMINGSVPSEFADTLDIISVDKGQLVLGSDGYSVTYQKK